MSEGEAFYYPVKRSICHSDRVSNWHLMYKIYGRMNLYKTIKTNKSNEISNSKSVLNDLKSITINLFK